MAQPINADSIFLSHGTLNKFPRKCSKTLHSISMLRISADGVLHNELHLIMQLLKPSASYGFEMGRTSMLYLA